MKFEHGKRYWVEAKDGSKILTEARLAGDGEYDLYCEVFDWSMWASPNNLEEYKVTEE